ncbi:MAG: DUF2075 domain-containing protein [Algoriphagus sp.]|uniref:DUF2075 domain-containing protein n=1 Tax=Algoriphagus sp. TaxID=1872435 RepID=UPI0018009425|nr:DUF2075 domain-containing protein [Algoriphagus sp.]NVJ85621.1 DUF2075 domain-containing protein [Algoriphagus sp.]
MLNFYYSDSINLFLEKSIESIIGEIAITNQFGNNQNEVFAWENQIKILKEALGGKDGLLYFEFSVPRMGKRIDCLLIIQNIVFILEFKVGEKEFHTHNIEQVWDYALDLKSFHQPSHDSILIPILIATNAKNSIIEFKTTSHNDFLFKPIKTNASDLKIAIEKALDSFGDLERKIGNSYAKGSYQPVPTIIEAAVSLYKNHTVEEITKSDSDAKNLNRTTNYISEQIRFAKSFGKKIICFVTGVPGAGKTLVGLKVATDHLDKELGDSSVYLSGNGPLVAVLQEALARDKVEQERSKGNRITKNEALKGVKSFIQIIHHYRDEYLRDKSAPYDHVAIFDEAQRAWTKDQTINFMVRKKGILGFDSSEPEFLISCLDRHKDWAVIVCLVGGGQEINTGEAGISEWITAIKTKFRDWETHISPHLFDSEYNAMDSILDLKNECKVVFNPDLHLGVSMRSIRAEKLSLFVKQLLDLKKEESKQTLESFQEQYPIVITRSIESAKTWLKEKARGSERYGIVVSSQAYRLKPLAIDVRSPINPVHWFLNGKDDIRSSYFLEDVATEFQVQGLELDWACVTWDGDLRYSDSGWKTFSFKGNKWQKINKEERQKYLINAYRVLLTRARKGMVLVVPEGNPEDHSRLPEFYDKTFEYFKSMGLRTIS